MKLAIVELMQKLLGSHMISALKGLQALPVSLAVGFKQMLLQRHTRSHDICSLIRQCQRRHFLSSPLGRA